MVETVGSCITETETPSWSAMRRGPTILQTTLIWKNIPFVWGWLVLLLQEGFQQHHVKPYRLCTFSVQQELKALA